MTVDREFLVGKRVTVLGLGIEGVDVARYLASHGADVTVSDAKSEEALTRQLQQLEGLPIHLALGGNRVEDAVAADLLFVSQGVPLTSAPVLAAIDRGIPISSMMKLFLDLCPGTVVGITGSSGKTTTTALVDAMFTAAGRKHVVGGNIGRGLLGHLDCIGTESWVVLEMSHSQLETADKSPHVACVLNVTPNHLDRYTWEEYTALKLRILQHQTKDDIAVLNLDDDVSCSFATETPGRVVWFSMRRVPNGGAAAYVREGGAVVWRQGSVETNLLPVDEIPLRGRHNVANVLAAVAVAGAVGLESDAVTRAIRAFTPVQHRLELVERIDGVAYYNDSIATTPERTLAALRSYDEPIVLLLGGRGKNLPLEELAGEAVERCRAIVCFGEAGNELAEALQAAASASTRAAAIERVATLADAVRAAHTLAKEGDVVLLSPACTSYDAYDNFEQRGEDFRRAVLGLGGVK